LSRFTETAYAKVNLALHVRGKRADGYHDIETIFAFCEDGDVLSGEDADDLTLEVSGPFAGEVPHARSSRQPASPAGPGCTWSRLSRSPRASAAGRPTRRRRCGC